MKRYFIGLLYQPTMKKHLSLFGIGFVLGALTFGFVNFEQSQRLGQLILSGVLGVLVAYLVFFSNGPLNRLLAWKKNTGIRLLLGILWNMVSTYGIVFICVGLYGYFTMGRPFLNSMDLETRLELGILLFCAAVIYNIAYFAFYSYDQYTTAQFLELRTERRQAELQLAALKSQLSPHFLFNCINSLSVLFHDHTEKAETFIRSMAKSYRYTLDNHSTSLISIREELAFVESYAFLLKTRFGDGFRLQVGLDANHLQSKIPPLTLQILVENAVKHNTVTKANPIKVTITGNEDFITITNTKIRKRQSAPSTGIGLKNITGRYGILSNAKIKIEDNTHFMVNLPLLKNE
ncbi:histidine kinase [Muricauda sp. SCSIO 64092]|uniref:sensor histidine kinase n=1 Tax=Allomuricauda sp. SCSIO 64092 TaxID=2908842 RepID=UPI001FF3195F|nr:histidine kinase [Muricauda sp. SCSIO 64092]UOY06599.1 histidine kinase [Muricauda sp. SCSIO 64092]